jgi:RND family efflux transporter MFP subunit
MKTYHYALAIILLFYGCKEKPEPEAIRPVKYSRVLGNTISDSRSFSGVSQAFEETRLSFKVAGKIDNLNVKVGSKVTEGELIASIDDADYQIQYKQALSQKEGAIAQRKSAEANLAANVTNLERIESLYQSSSISLREYEQAKASHDAAQAQYDAAKTQVITADLQVEAAGKQLSETRLLSPARGVITEIMVEKNELVNAGNTIVEMSTDEIIEVVVGMPEGLISQLQVGDEAEITFSSFPENTFKGIISELSFTPDRSSTFPVVLSISNPTPQIRPGMAVTVIFNFNDEFNTEASEIVIPSTAVSESGGINYVFVLEPDENDIYIVRKREVQTGNLVKNGFVIESGLEPGELIATAGLKSLRDQKKVKLLEQ